MTRSRALILAALAVLALGVVWSARPQPETAQQRVTRIASELRCPVCQGLSVADSPSETARAMQDLIAERVAEGRSDDQIRDEFRRAYGDWILLAPPATSPSVLIWLAPLVAVLPAAAVAWRRARAPAPPPAPLSAQERARLDAALGGEEPR